MKVLIADDDRTYHLLLKTLLSKWGYDVVVTDDGQKALHILQQSDPPRLAILDWMMPGISGINYIKSLRRNEKTDSIPVIMLTAKTEEKNMLEGLDSGADDYLSKPFSTEELKARIRALLRRTSNTRSNEILNVANLTLDNTSHRVSSNGEIVTLGPTEYNLLAFFMRSPERVYSREQLLNGVWGESVYVEERTVDVHIRRLRKALEPSSNQDLIQTVRGAGYRLSTQ